MPKASPIQTNFNSGEFSPLLYGRVDSERYKTGLATCFNYIPTLQGPLIRRPGTKYVGDVKDPSKPPTLIPFQFSASQAYILEFGDLYVRFYANGGQIITSSNTFKVAGIDTFTATLFPFTANRTSAVPLSGETFTASTLVAAGSILEIVTPYAYADIAGIKFAQNADTMYLTHPQYPVYKLQRRAQTAWDLKPVQFKDGPYLQLNSYKDLGDSLPVCLIPNATTGGTFTTGPVIVASSFVDNGVGNVRVNTEPKAHGHLTGDRVVIKGAQGTIGSSINNVTTSIPLMFYTVANIDATHFDLIGSVFSAGTYVGSGFIYPALFEPNPIVPGWVDVGRNVRLTQVGSSVWGYVLNVTDMSQCQILFSPTTPVIVNSSVTYWFMGSWKSAILPSNFYPSAVCFHQNRLAFTGAPNRPQEINMSVSGDYENFAPNNTANLQVLDTNALQFNLNSTESNPLRWLKSTSQGLLTGSYSSEWDITPSTQNGVLTPTNFNANQTSFFGSADVDAVTMGNAALYVQRAGRKVREMHYFFQVGTFRSTDLTELSEHITIPTITKLAVQREPIPITWGLRSDGLLTSMTYNRDDQNLKVGWARHQLGGQSDPAGTNPIVKSIAVIPGSSAIFDQLWMTTQRNINGTSCVGIEYMTRVYDDSIPQEDAYQFDYGSTYDFPVAINNITNTGSCLVTATSHGFASGSTIQIVGAIGLKQSVTDINGNITSSSLVNYKTFVVASTATNTFYLKDFAGNFITSSSYSSYISGGFARKMVSRISGLTWLKGETLGVLADGAPHPDVTVNSGGFFALSYPAAKVQVGYRYNSDGKLLRPDAGSADGSAIGKTRRITRVAVQLHQSGDFSMGMDFNNLLPIDFRQADFNLADTAIPLWSGIQRDGVESGYDFDSQVCFRQSTGLPGMVQSFTLMLEEVDV